MLQDEIRGLALALGMEEFGRRLFGGLEVTEEARQAISCSLLTGRHLLLTGPPGSGKTALTQRIGALLQDTQAVAGCPVNCAPEDPSCPWCQERLARGEALSSIPFPARMRVKKIQGSGDLVPEDLMGDLDLERALRDGLRSLSAFIPGKLLRANRCLLIIDFLDRMPERVLNIILQALEGDSLSVGAFEERFPLDSLVVATGSARGLQGLPLDLVDHFEVVPLSYPSLKEQEAGIVRRSLGTALGEEEVERVVDIVSRTRSHHEVERGASTRGTLRYAELLAAYSQMGQDGQALRKAAFTSLPHRLELALELDIPGKREDIVQEVLDEALGGEKPQELVSLSKEDLLALVEEIAREDKFRKPLKYGAFDILLKRIQRFPDSQLARLHREAVLRLQQLYPERFKKDNLTLELLEEFEEVRHREERAKKARRELETEALAQTLQLLEKEQILQKGSFGWELSHRGITFLLERLTPRVWESIYTYGYGKHATGKKFTIGEGRVVGVRQYRFGDHYRDISFKDTMRQAIRHRRPEVTKEDIMVTTKDIRAKLDIILVVDLSGTMRQLEKLWYAKESAIALALAAAQSGDRLGVVAFSNLAEVIVDVTGNPHRVTRKVIDLELHENAFTNIGFGLVKACQLFDRHRGGRASRHIILISDGDATAPHPSPQKYALRQAARAARKGISISCVCINEESTDPELMRRLARIGKGRTYLIGPEGMAEAVLQERLLAKSR